MKIKIPAKTVSACDLCERHTELLNECKVCRKSYCYGCDGGHIGECIHKADVCRDCGRRSDVRKVCKKFAPRLTRTLDARDRAFAALPRKAPAQPF